MEWTTALPDWEDRILSGKSLLPCGPLFPDEGREAMRIFRELKLPDVRLPSVEGTPTMGQACRPWILDFAEVIFGAYDKESGRRLINDFFLHISKKNAKSTIAAGIMVTALVRNWRKSAELIILAPTIEIAKNSAGAAMDMVAEDAELREILRPIPHQRTIEHRTTRATLKIIAADSDVVGGKKASFVLIDELWLFGKMSKAKDILREAVGGLASRPEGFVIALSTQSDDPPAGVFKDWLTRFRDIRDGVIVAPRSLGVLYEFPKALLDSGDFKKPEYRRITNPNLGASVDDQFLDDEFAKASRDGPGSMAGFFSKHLNVEIGLNLRSDRWLGADHWLKNADPTITLDTILARSDLVVAGVDGGGLDDLLGLAIMGRDSKTKDWLVWARAWAHRDILSLRKEIAPRLQDFERDGDLSFYDRAGDDVVEIADIIERIRDTGLLPDKNAIGVDQAGITDITDAIQDRGVPPECIAGIGQGWKLQNSILDAERSLERFGLKHAKQPLMDWCIGNAKIERRGNAYTITKQAAGIYKIDPLMAMLDAVAVMREQRSAAREHQLFFLG